MPGSGTKSDVDVVLPLRNPAPWLHETLDGLEKQDFAHWNLICTIHEDSLGLGDQVLSRFPTAQVISVSDKLNFPTVLNIGVRSGSAKYIARLDQDDIPLPERLSKQFVFLEHHPSVAVVASRVIVIDSNSRVSGTSFQIPSQSITKKLMVKNCIAHPSIMMRRDTFTRVNGYNEEAVNGEDYELWLRIASVAEIACLKEPLLKYRRHGLQMSNVGFMDAKARSRVRQARLELAGEGSVNVARAQLLHLLWSVPQVWRGWRRKGRGINA